MVHNHALPALEQVKVYSEMNESCFEELGEFRSLEDLNQLNCVHRLSGLSRRGTRISLYILSSRWKSRSLMNFHGSMLLQVLQPSEYRSTKKWGLPRALRLISHYSSTMISLPLPRNTIRISLAWISKKSSQYGKDILKGFMQCLRLDTLMEWRFEWGTTALKIISI